MRLARTSVVVFLSDVLTSVVGFLATVYFARELGSAVLGQYFIVVALVAWLAIPTQGVGSAMTKRMSEGVDREAFLGAGFLLNGAIAVVVAAGSVAIGPSLNSYVGADVSFLFGPLFVVHVGFSSVMSGLAGQQMVAQSGLLKTLDRIVRTALQVGLAYVGYGVLALVGGEALALVVSIGVGLAWSRIGFAVPTREHARELYSYARYAWLSMMKGKTFGWMDTLALSLFVGPGLIGVYEVSWRLASMLILVSNAVQRTLFPEMSDIATNGDEDELLSLLDEGLFAAGLFVIPGFFGAALLGSKILRIYGPEFVQGQWILLVLIVARGIDAYGTQFETLINAFDRPDLMFRVNFLFIVSNTLLNLGLIYLFGWVGAAVATALSSLLIVSFGFYYVTELLGAPDVPVAGILKQVGAGLVMAGCVFLLQVASPWSNMFVTVALVFSGAAVFFLVLFAISERFRRKAVGVLPDAVRRGQAH
jgi:O-antigen/teichoic acid export membrane protein